MTTSTQTPQVINGIDVTALQSCIDAIQADPGAGQSRWTIHSQWMGGTRSDHHVDGVEIGGNPIDRKFLIQIDEPFELTGTNEHPNPQEYLLAALNACMMVGYAAVAALMGIRLTKLEVRTTGDIDLRGFLGIDAQVPNGYQTLEQRVMIDGDGTPGQFESLHRTVQMTSPNYFNLTHAVPVRSTLVVG
ncbi:MAG: OsmC family protein [Phycisphaeraceae bacterium]|nr:OsmC family protein [Phycisphaeraceae bacterium]